MAVRTQLCYSATVENKFALGVTVLIVRDEKILLGKRINCFGAGNWGLPGGHVDMGELLVDAAKRELLEETGMTAERLMFANIVEKPDEEAHYVIAAFLAVHPRGEPEMREPDKCEEWRWFNIAEVPENTVASHFRQIELYKAGKTFAG